MSSSCKKIEVVVKAAVGQPDKLGDCKLCTDPVSENSNLQFLHYFLETTFYYHFLLLLSCSKLILSDLDLHWVLIVTVVCDYEIHYLEMQVHFLNGC